jgi:alpha-N-arabinofuranosidase
MTKKNKNILLYIVGVLTIFSYIGVNAQNRNNSNNPVFTGYSYQGDDEVYKSYPLNENEFYTPILQGCYPDPSIVRKGDDYFMVTSSFVMFPGVPIFHSKDLVNWKQIGHVLDRKSQLKVHSAGISEGIYAPAIRYNEYNDTFYMITTQFAEGIDNMVVKTKDPFKGWSEVIELDFGGIDPSLFFDDDGKAYVIHNDAPNRGEALYEGHRVIKIWDYDLEKDQVVPGTDKIIVDGGVDITQEPIWIEAPHIYKRDGKYYLMCAEGGTSDWHSEVIFISDNPRGPYKPADNNPILSQRYLDNDRENRVEWVGHADMVLGPDGKHYGVFLGIRPNEKDMVNTGRETFILPVDWSGDFPVFQNGLIPMEPKLTMPEGVVNRTGKDGFFENGNFTFTDNFTTAELDYRWIGVRGPREDFISVGKEGLQIKPFATDIKAKRPISTLFQRQQHKNFTSTVKMSYVPSSENDLAGVVCYQSESFNYVFGITKKDNEFYLLLERTERGRSQILESTKIDITKPIELQVSAEGDNYMFNYSTDGVNFTNLGGTVSGDILSTNVAGGFTGNLVGLYATTGNKAVPK